MLKDYLDRNPYDKVDVPRPVKRGVDDIPEQQALDRFLEDHLKLDLL